MLITHDLGVVAGVADRMMVMYGGRCVETGTRRDISELNRATGRGVVAIERGGRGFARGVLRQIPRPPGRIDEEQVGIAVVVEIEERHAAAERLGEELLTGRAIVVNEGDARRPRNVGELHLGQLGLRLVRHDRRGDGGLDHRAFFLRTFQVNENTDDENDHEDEDDGGPAEGFADDLIVLVNEFIAIVGWAWRLFAHAAKVLGGQYR